MKQNINKYHSVTELPKGALTVKQYAEKENITTSYVYKKIREGKADFKIVTFQSINFIVPSEN